MRRPRRGRTKETVSTAPDIGEKVAASLYRDHGESLWGYVARKVPGHKAEHADDVVQETFFRTITYLKKGKTVDSPRGFLFQTARNIITSMFYRNRHHTETDSWPDMEDQAASDSVSSPEHRAVLRQKLDVFNVAMEAIPERYREAFVRRRVYGESCREIAKEMGVTEHVASNYAVIGWKLLSKYCEEHEITLGDFDESE